MSKVVLADAGALVALLDRGDAHHAWAQDCFRKMPSALHTCEPVLTETLHLLRRAPPSDRALLALWGRDILRVTCAAENDKKILAQTVARYGKVPMSFADACLVRMSELHSDCVVWTTDSDFKIYRRHGRQVIPVLTPRE